MNKEKPKLEGTLSEDEARTEAYMIEGKLNSEINEDKEKFKEYRKNKGFSGEDYERVSGVIDQLKIELEKEPGLVKGLYELGRVSSKIALALSIPLLYVENMIRFVVNTTKYALKKNDTAFTRDPLKTFEDADKYLANIFSDPALKMKIIKEIGEEKELWEMHLIEKEKERMPKATSAKSAFDELVYRAPERG